MTATATPAPHAPGLARPVWQQLLILVWPALLQQSLLLSIQLSDQYFARDYSGAHKAALTTGNYVYWFITSYAVVVNAGATAVVGRLVGAGDRATASRAAAQALALALGFGLLAFAASLVGLRQFVALLRLEGGGADYAVAYLRPLAALLPLYMVEVAGIACLVGAGDTRTGLKVLATVACINLPCAYFLSRGAGGWAGYGFVGIALGTGLAHAGGCILVVSLLLRGRYGLRLRLRDLRPDPDLMRRLLRVSIPAAVDSMSLGVFQFVFLGIINGLGETAAAAHGNAIRLEGFGYLSGAAFATATAAIVGRSLGAGRPDIAARAAWTALGIGAGVMSGMGVIFFTFARPLFEIFNSAGGSPEVVEAGVPVLRLVAFAMPALAGSIILTQALRAAGDTRVPVLFTWVGFVGVRLPLAYLLTRPAPWPDLGLLGAWLAMVVDINVRGVFYMLRFYGGKWKSVRV